jgi:two-component system response regulator YesN
MSSVLGYNPKYISQLFKKKMSVGVNEYLNTVRVQSACTMIEQGTTSVSDIANKCGYADPQYFSRIFKQKMSVSPLAYIKALHKPGTQ